MSSSERGGFTTGGSACLKAARILVVDDEPAIRAVVSKLLLLAGYHVEIASDGIQALALADSFSADLVITDLSMPRLDGISLTRKLIEQNPVRPAIIMTTERESAPRAAGATGYLAKPIEMASLI